MILNCQCCAQSFDWVPRFAIGQKPKYCPKCSNGHKGSYGVRICATCGTPFVSDSRGTVNCKLHRRKPGPRIVTCNVAGCSNTFEARGGSHNRKRCDIHRKGTALGCKTCGGMIPRDRVDSYCSWQHNPDFLTDQEYKTLKAQYARRVG